MKTSKGRHLCNKCEYVVSRGNYLKIHVDSVHRGVRHQCSPCEFSTTTASSLRFHVKSKHEGIKYPLLNVNILQYKQVHWFFMSEINIKELNIRSQCQCTASQKGDPKSQIKDKHEGVRYPYSDCEYIATTVIFGDLLNVIMKEWDILDLIVIILLLQQITNRK